jgi:diaminopimelate decarboxylase
MPFFEYRDQHLHSEGVALKAIADRLGTPFYCYSTAAFQHYFRQYELSFPAPRHLICYAVKANSNQAVLKVLARAGAGADVVSEGELRRAIAAGMAPDRIVFSGVAKTSDEMKYALSKDILQFNVESEQELLRLNQTAIEEQKVARVAFRINPDIDARTHAKISTGKFINKFGLPWNRAREVYALSRELPGIEVQGIAMHIGSQLTDLQPYQMAFERLAQLTDALRADGHEIKLLDIGGGLGIDYHREGPAPPSIEQYADVVHSTLGHLDCRILLEPGRSIAGPAGCLVSKVEYEKHGEGERFLIIDAGMNDLLRPALYDATHAIIPEKKSGAETRQYQVVGPVCETGDTFSTSCDLPALEQGDLLAILDAGAYGAVMSFTYNTRPMLPEVLVDGESFYLVRKRQSYEELISLDVFDPCTQQVRLKTQAS